MPETTSRPLTQATLAELIEEVEKKWPTAKFLASDIDTVSVFDYFNRLVRTNKTAETQNRRVEFQKELREETKYLLGDEVADSVYEQLKTNHSIATAQHFTPISSPFTMNPTLQTALGYFGKDEADRKNLIVLACAGISFANHYVPRSYFFHTLSENGIEELQLPFFGRAIDPNPVISKSAYTIESLQQIEKRIRRYQSEKVLKKSEFEKIQELFKIIFSEEVMQQENFIDQITIQNYHIWKRIFASYPTMPNLVFLSQEKVAAKLIKNYHLASSTILHNMIFNPEFHKLMLQYFNNITCAFSVERKYGTFLFWAMKKDTTQRLQLFPKDGKLVSLDETYTIEMTPETIGKALETGELVPGVLLTFLVISLYYGLYISGGLLQPWYLSEAKYAYLKMLTELKEEDEVNYCSSIATNDSVITRPTLAFLDTPNISKIPATGLDIILHGNPQAWPEIVEATKHITYKQMLYRTYPDIYKNYAQDEHKKDYLLTIDEKEIEVLMGIENKIPAWGMLS